MPSYMMYVSISGEDRIARFAMDPATGALTPRDDVPVQGRPAPIAVDPGRRFLYIGRRNVLQVSSYRIDLKTGALSHIAATALENEPCWLATDRKGKFLLSAYYLAGAAAVHAIGDNGVVASPPVQALKTYIGAHCFQTDPSNRFAFVPHISGPDRGNVILQFRFDEATGRLTPNSPDRVSQQEGTGPRHFCFHPSLDAVYFSNEQGCSVTAYRFDRAKGTLSPFQTVSTLPAGFQGKNSCSKIQISPSGKFLYAPNRGHNSIACFSVDTSTGSLKPIRQVPSERIPRAFTIDPTGNFLYSAGFESGRLASFRINKNTGDLEPMAIYDVGKQPMWVTVIGLAG
ncbi:MAG: lactonase family protein [Chloroflexi bacterium]|nr:lactonase family protein [Chloroflexota bacterium]